MSDRAHELDAPYYAGTVTVRPADVVAVIQGDNGGSTLVLRGGGHVRVVQNERCAALVRAAGLSR